MNICFSSAWGGLEMSTVKITRLFQEAGHRSIGVTLPNSPIEKAMLGHSLTTLTTPARNYLSPATTWRLRRWIQEHQIEAIYLHSLRDLWLVTPALVGLPAIRLNAFARMFLRNISKNDFGHRAVYSRVNHLICLSHIQKEALLKCLPVSAEQTVVIPNGVDIDRFQPRPRRRDLRIEWGIQEHEPLFGLIGRIDPQKGSMEFIEAAIATLEHFPHARFVLVGGNTAGSTDYGQAVLHRIQSAQLEDKIIFTDFRDDIPAVFNAIDFFVMPSYEENFGNVLLEALASGVPIIGTNSGGTPEILDQGRCGLLVEPKSSAALADAMIKLLASPEFARDLALRGRAKAMTEYDMDRVFQRIERLAQA